MPSTRGRQVVLPLTNKSGGSVVAGDVVVIDTANDTAFTTTTSARSEVSVSIAQEAIANNATGRVLVEGYAALVNVPTSVTRGHYVETHTVAKQATGNSSRRSGSFGQFLTGGATPTAWLWGKTDQTAAAGGVAPWSLVPEGGAWAANTRSVGAANRAVYAPCSLQAAATITGVRLLVGTQSGNICVGLYDSSGSRVATSGSVACPASGLASVSFTGNYSASAGRFYLALAADNTTATFGWCESAAGASGPATSRHEASAFPLPATASFSQPISTPAIVGLISGGHP